MNYRINKRTGDRISEIGFGSAYLYEAGMKEGVRALETAVEGGINYFDLAAGDGAAPLASPRATGCRKSPPFFEARE